MSISEYRARDLLFRTVDELFVMPDEVFWLVFDDNRILTTKERTIWSHFLWDIHRRYERVPLLSNHHIGEEAITPTSHIKILSTIKAIADETYGFKGTNASLEAINDIVHKSFNNMYNQLTDRLQEYVATADAVDVLEVMTHPVISSINDSVSKVDKYPTAKEIDDAHKAIEAVLRTDEALNGNSVAIAVRNSLVRVPQLIQCISVRGYMTEIDNNNFKVPMLTSYSTGMRTLTNYACDSRTASIAAFAQASTMSKFQYQNRYFQIFYSDIKNIHDVDCGTQSYTTVFVDTMEKLDHFVGKYIMTDDGWKVIDHKDPNNLNKPLKLRTLVDCIYPDRHGFCSKCFGELATSIVDGDGVGQVVVAHIQEKQSQGALSVKHYSANAKDVRRELPSNALKWFEMGNSATTSRNIYLTKNGKKENIKLMFSPKEVENINNLATKDDVGSSSLSRYTKVSRIMVESESDGVTTSETVDINCGAEYASLSSEALKYGIENHWSIGFDGYYILDLTDWDIKKHLFQIPKKKHDMVHESKKYDNFLKGSAKNGIKATADTILGYKDFGEAIMGFQDLTIGSIPMRISHMEVMLYGMMSADPDNGDYRLPNPTNRKSGKFVSFNTKTYNVNMSVAMSFERQNQLLTRPSSFVNKLRSPSDFDYFVIEGEKL